MKDKNMSLIGASSIRGIYNRQLGQTLLERGVINFKQLMEALKIQKNQEENKKTIGEILIEEFNLKKEDIERSVCESLEIYAKGLVNLHMKEAIAVDPLVKKGKINEEKMIGIIDDFIVDFLSASIIRRDEVFLVKKNGIFRAESNRYLLDKIKGRMCVQVKIVEDVLQQAAKNDELLIPDIRCFFTYSIPGKEFIINESSLYALIKPHMLKIYRMCGF